MGPIITIFLALGCAVHPIKLTTGKLKYQEESGRLEVTLNFFIDDFGAHLQEVYQVSEMNLTDHQHDQVILDYIRHHFQLRADQRVLTLTDIQTLVVDENVIQVKLFSDEIRGATIERMEITNSLLLEAFPQDQINILYYGLVKNEENRMLRFSSNEPVQTVYEKFEFR